MVFMSTQTPEEYFNNVITGKPEVIRSFTAFFLPAIVQPLIDYDIDTRNYKTTALHGFMHCSEQEVNNNYDPALKILVGRQFEERDPFFTDNISLLGIAIGIRNLQNNHEYVSWFQNIMRQKASLSDEQAIQSDFLNAVICKESKKKTDNTIEDLILIVISAILKDGLTDNISKQISLELYSKLNQMDFPYFDDFYLNVLAHHCYINILSKYCFDDLITCVNKSRFYDTALIRINKLSDIVVVCALLTVTVLSLLLTYLFVHNNGWWNIAEPVLSFSGLSGFPFGLIALYLLFFNRKNRCTDNVSRIVLKFLRML